MLKTPRANTYLTLCNSSPAMVDLQRIVDTTQAHIIAQPECFEHAATPTDNPREQRVPRVQTTADVPLPHTEINRRIRRTMSMSPPVPRVPSPNETTNKTPAPPTHPMSWVCTCKWHIALLRHAESKINMTPHVQTWAQVATETARAVPPALSTRARVHQSTLPPPSYCPGLLAVVMGQQQHQRGMV